MTGELLLTLLLGLGAVLLLQEIRHWWRPVPASSPLRYGYRGAPPRRRVTLRIQRHHLQGMGVGAGAALIFFLLTANWLFASAAGLAVWGGALGLLPRWQRRRFSEQARAELRVALDLLAVALRSGQSLPTALDEWPEALARALGTERSVLVAELRRVREEMARGATAEEALESMAERLRLEETRMLAGVVSLCRRRGGDLELPIAQAAQMISDALDVRGQIRTLTAGKRTEGAILTLLPPVMLLLLMVVTPTYIMPFLQSTTGRYILAIVLVMEAASFLLGRWLLQSDL